MNANGIEIECQEDGFWLFTYGEDGVLETARRIEDPEALYDHVKAIIGPWLYERDHNMERYSHSAAWDKPRLSDEDFEAYVNDAYADDWPKAEGMRQMREKGLI